MMLCQHLTAATPFKNKAVIKYADNILKNFATSVSIVGGPVGGEQLKPKPLED